MAVTKLSDYTKGNASLLYVGTVAPVNTTSVWVDTTSGAPEIKTYNDTSTTWVSGSGGNWKPPTDTLNDLPVIGNIVGDVRIIKATGEMYRCIATTGTITEQWDIVGGGNWKPPISTSANLPTTTNRVGDVRIIQETGEMFLCIAETGLASEQWKSVGGGTWKESVANYSSLPVVDNRIGEVRLDKSTGDLYHCIATTGEIADQWASVGNKSWKDAVETKASLPVTGNVIGQIRLVKETGELYQCIATTGEYYEQWNAISSSTVKETVSIKANLPLTNNTLNDVRLVADEGIFYRCIATTGELNEQWNSISKSAVEVSDTAPTDTSVLWVDTSGSLPELKKYITDGWALIGGSIGASVLTYTDLPLEGNVLGSVRLVRTDTNIGPQLYQCTNTTGPANIQWTVLTNRTHSHNTSYYLKGEVNTLLGNKANSGHTHTASTVTMTVPGVSGGVISSTNLQTALGQLDTGKQTKADKGIANGYCELNSLGKVPTTRLPSLNLSTTKVVASEEEQLALSARPGDLVVRSDEAKSYVRNEGTTNTMSDWTWLQIPSGTVLSVNGFSDTVVIDAGDITCAYGTIQEHLDHIESAKSETTHLHDDRYFTETELANGAIDGRYYYKSQFRPDTGDIEEATYNSEGQFVGYAGVTGALDTRYPPLQRFFRDGYDRYTGRDYNHTIQGCGAIDARYYCKEAMFGTHEFNEQGVAFLNTAIGKAPLDSYYYRKSELTGGALDGRYYTETETDAKIASAVSGDHVHDDKYYRKSAIDTTFSNYYTKTQIDAINYDSRYFTETELTTTGVLDTRYYTKSDIDEQYSLGFDPSHKHDDRYRSRSTETWQQAVINTTTTTPPSSPAVGDRYLIAANATGDWAGKTNQTVECVANDPTIVWYYYTPVEGAIVCDKSSDLLYIYHGSTWSNFRITHNHDDKYSLNTHVHDDLYPTITNLTTSYYTKEAIDTMLEEGINPIHDHDTSYYTKTLLDAGQLDTRYFTETELTTTGVLDTRYTTTVLLNTNFHDKTNIDHVTTGCLRKDAFETWKTTEGSAAVAATAAANLASHVTAGHPTLYYTKTQGDARYAPIAHEHTGLYYTQTECDTLFGSGEVAVHSHLSSEITITPAGNITEVTLEGALYELDTIKEGVANKGAASGYCELDTDSLIPIYRIPDRAIVNMFEAESEEVQLALVAKESDWCIRTDTSTTYFHNAGATGTMTDWTELSVAGSVIGSVGAADIVIAPHGNISSGNVQAAIYELDNEKQATSAKGQASGYAGLDSTGKVPVAQLPSIAIVDVNTVADQAAQLALTNVQEGDVCIRTDNGLSYIHNGGTAGTIADWSLLTTNNIVSVNGVTSGVIQLDANDIPFTATGSIVATDVQAAIAELDTEKAASSHDHNSVYFTETELGATTDGSSGADLIGATTIDGVTGTTVQAQLESLKTLIGSGGGSGLNSIAKTIAYTAIANDEIFADTTSGSFTITLPTTPTQFDKIVIIDAGGTWDSNNITVARNGSKIMGQDQDLVCDTKNITLELRYFNTARGWIIV